MRNTPEHHALNDLGFFGHFLHVHAGGRSGKQHILITLLFQDGHGTQRELQEHSHISSAALSEVLAKLEGEGLIRRTRSEQDKRQLDIELTDSGRDRAETLMRKKLNFERECLSSLSPNERVLFVEMLDKVKGHWEQMEEEGDIFAATQI